MERDSFVFYKSFITGIDTIPDAEEQLKAYKYIIRYGIFGEEPEEENSIAYGFFAMAKPQIDANNKRFAESKKGGAPVGNQNARKKRDAVENGEKQLKQLKQPTVDFQNNGKQPNVNVNVNVNDNVNEKECEEKRDVVITLDADASRGNIEDKDAVVKKNKREVDDETLKGKLLDYGLNEDVVDLAIIYNGCKKGKKLSKFDDKQLGIWVKKLRRCGFETDEGMKQVIENSIAGNYEGIFELKQPIKPTPKYGGSTPKVIEKGGYYFYNA